MAPVRVPKSQRTQELAMAPGVGSEIEEQSQPGSQSSDDNQVTKLATEMHREASKRREARRTFINKSHRKAVRKIEDAMTIKFEEITRRMIDIHRLRMERLDDVIQRRSTIEAKMIASIRGIENAYVYADKALASAFGCRLQSNGKRHNVGSKDPRIHPY